WENLGGDYRQFHDIGHDNNQFRGFLFLWNEGIQKRPAATTHNGNPSRCENFRAHFCLNYTNGDSIGDSYDRHRHNGKELEGSAELSHASAPGSNHTGNG